MDPQAGLSHSPAWLAPSDNPAPEVFAAMFSALEVNSQSLIGPATQRLLVIPLRDDDGAVAGGLWGSSHFRWLHVQMLIVPEPLRGQGVGSALMTMAETEARDRGCLGAYVDTFSFQAVSFYQKRGYSVFGVLDNFPPGHQRVYLQKRFDA
jgi:GNAT superfamily N-acetyltransferase